MVRAAEKLREWEKKKSSGGILGFVIPVGPFLIRIFQDFRMEFQIFGEFFGLIQMERPMPTSVLIINSG